MSENPFEILRDWAQEPENIETIAQAVQALQHSITQLNAHLSAASSVSVSSVSPSAAALASAAPLPQNLGNIWIVGPNPTDTTIILRYIGEPNEPLTLSTGIQNLLIGGILLFLSGPAQGYPTIITAVASNGTLTFDPVDHTPNPGDRFVFLSNFAATPGSAYTPGQQGSLPSSGNNTVTIPTGVTVNMDVQGQYANNTIIVIKNGTGLTTTIKAQSMLGSNITVTEGDTLIVRQMQDSSVYSFNSAGGLEISSQPTANSFTGPGSCGTWYYLQPANYTYPSGTNTIFPFSLEVGAEGTLTITVSNIDAGGNQYWQLDSIYGAWTYAGQSTNDSLEFSVPLPIGSHTLYIATVTATTCFGYDGFSNGPIVAALGAPSSMRINDILNSGVIAYGDSINVIGEMVANSSIRNETNEQIDGSQIVVLGNLSDATIAWASRVNVIVNEVSGATIQVPASIDVTTTINYTGTITEDLTTTASQTTYVGTDLIAGYTAPSSDPSIVLSTIVEPTGVLYVPAGNVAAYTTVTDEGFVKVAGKLLTNNLTIEAGAQLVLDADGVVELGAFI